MIMRTKREAERRKAQSNHGRAISGARQRATQTSVRSLRTHLLAGRARLPALHRGTSPIARLISGPRFLELPGANGRTLPGASAASTSRTGHSAGRDDARSRPRAECVVPPAGTAPAPPSGAPSRKASLDDSMSGMVMSNTISDACQAIVIVMRTILRLMFRCEILDFCTRPIKRAKRSTNALDLHLSSQRPSSRRASES